MMVKPEDLGRILANEGIIPSFAVTHAHVYDGGRTWRALVVAAAKIESDTDAGLSKRLADASAEAARWRGIANQLANGLADAHFTWMDPKPTVETMALARSVKDGTL